MKGKEEEKFVELGYERGCMTLPLHIIHRPLTSQHKLRKKRVGGKKLTLLVSEEDDQEERVARYVSTSNPPPKKPLTTVNPPYRPIAETDPIQISAS